MEVILTYQVGSKLKSIIFSPFLHYLHEVFDLWVISILKHLNNFNQSLLALFPCYHHLEHSDCCSSLALPELGVWIKSLEHVKGLDRVVELSHLVAVIGDQVQERQ